MSIDARAVVDASARLGNNVSIGPFSIIGPEVEIGDDSWIGPHVVISGYTRLGKGNRIYQFASIGEIAQDKKYRGEEARLEIGDNNTIREYSTINRGTADGGGVTRVGNDNWLMAYMHIAHDCSVGNHTIFANAASIAGHVKVDDYAILGGFTCVHQFVHIGAHAFTGLGSTVLKDIPPYVIANGNPVQPHGLNIEGLKRKGFSKEDIRLIREAYKLIYRSGLTLEDARQQIEQLEPGNASLQPLLDFLQDAQRGIIR